MEFVNCAMLVVCSQGRVDSETILFIITIGKSVESAERQNVDILIHTRWFYYLGEVILLSCK